jgi:hypothetical protein
MSSRGCRTLLLVAVASAASVSTIAAVASGNTATVNCTSRQLRLRGHLSGATQSLLGALTLANRSGRACALPPAPRRASLIIGGHLLPTLTVLLKTPGVPTRTLPAHGAVGVRMQWRNWCGALRGEVRAALVMTIYPGVMPRLALGTVTTPPCADAKYSSTVAVSQFLRN